ncbi:probable lysophospholipase BODYGUARD 3 isoform X2 [Prosopis cineraria]|uniref:probable lysophospholipase BODYGUARD 3 isoform X2 n=1 Tax=Prosopis cineraria TaxID=364024 RepID=UPI002410B3C0|nr:probable lysophospholipase BODYGUARD 3 isoform X2 [Prosopis cineraria]
MGDTARRIVASSGRVINKGVSWVAFCILDLLDIVLCVVFKVVDLVVEGEWKPCYCSPGSAKEAMRGGDILVSEHGGESKILSLTTSSKVLQLEDISDTLFSRPSLLSHQLKRFHDSSRKNNSTSFTVNSTIVEMLGRRQQYCHHPTTTRWSDCDCQLCTGWISPSSKGKLFVRTQGPMTTGGTRRGGEDVVFIHGFISSSSFWTETLFPNFSGKVKSSYRLFAVDLLGFGRSPKPSESLYTLREHLEMLETSVLEPYRLQSFHIVAHSLGCILALALAPFYPVPKAAAAQATQYMMSRVAPRRVWPPITFGASMACWYEHITRLICFVICKNHRLWEFLTKLITRNRLRTFLLEGFFCHTHNAAWHTLHNIICGTAGKMEAYLDAVNDNLNCKVTVFHGKDDELIPLECSYELQRRIPRANVRVIDDKDHLTIVVGRQQDFARELEQIWTSY